MREMGENKTVSVNRIYVPNEFHVEMGSEDYERFTQMESGLQKEFSEIVIEAAKENRWNLMGMPEITFSENEAFAKGPVQGRSVPDLGPRTAGQGLDPRARRCRPRRDPSGLLRHGRPTRARRFGGRTDRPGRTRRAERTDLDNARTGGDRPDVDERRRARRLQREQAACGVEAGR